MNDFIPINVIPAIRTDQVVSLSNYREIDSLITDTLSIYVHFPFCRSRCLFCPIKTEPYNTGLIKQYISALKEEIAFHKERMRRHPINCIHFGGGTPSLMDASEVADIIGTIGKYTNISEAEILFEAHPMHLSYDMLTFLSSLSNCTINLGVQSFDKFVLSSMYRDYDDENLLHRLEFIHSKVKSIGIDLICDLPASNFNTLEHDIQSIKKLHPEHISQYPLNLEGNPRILGYKKQHNDIFLKIEDKIKINEAFEQRLSLIGYKRYSAFHYGSEGNNTHQYGRSQLNGGQWIGFGAESYSYLGNVTYTNLNLYEYIKGNYTYKNIQRMDYTEQFLWKFAYFIRCIPLTRDTVVKQYGAIVIKCLDMIIDALYSKCFIHSPNDIALTWKGIMHLNDVEQIIMRTKERLYE